ncbi:hypothetical protein Dsin_009177 [Dipteronia sinensis]|uniref:Ubiquitin-like protease family profile domain-containing protein n=1 Tax=Dipteronia sinensis TaxID=43782 RepID=A0AAE0AQH3_9ROSI|nr:hypothetical protein Dsin_009177 [Dipteronia sinensis]
MTLYYCQKAFKHRGDWGYNLYGFPWAIQIWAMESIPCLTNLLATRRAHKIPRFRNWLFQLKPNGLDNEFKDEIDVVETLEPIDAERQQPYMIGFDNNFRNVGNLESESQNFFKQIEDRWSWMSSEKSQVANLASFEENMVLLSSPLYVLMPCNIGGYHWVLSKLWLKQQTIAIYDSNQGNNPDIGYTRCIELTPLRYRLPAILHASSYYDKWESIGPLDWLKQDSFLKRKLHSKRMGMQLTFITSFVMF